MARLSEEKLLSLGRTLSLLVCLVFYAVASSGQQVTFERSYNVQPHTFISCILQSDTNLYMYAGSRFFRTDLEGDNELLLNKSIGTAYDVIETDNGFLYGGYKFAPAGQIWVLKVDRDGNTIWDRAYGTTGIREIYTMANFPDGGFAFAGPSQTGIWRCDSVGDTLWTYKKVTLLKDVYSILRTDDDGIIAVGGLGTQPSQGKAIVKLDSLGEVQWNSIIWPSSPSSFSLFLDVITTDSGVVAAGVTTNDTSNMVAYRHNGTVMWSKKDVYITKMTKYDNTSFVCIDGATTNACWDYAVVSKWTNDGTLLWQHCYPGLGNFGVELRDIAVSNDKCIYVVGNQRLSSSGTPYRMYMMKLDSMGILTDIHYIDPPIHYGKVNVFPNPASGSIYFSIESDRNAIDGRMLEIYNLKGQKLLNENISSRHTSQFDLTGFNAGIFIYKVVGKDGFFETGKFVVQR